MRYPKFLIPLLTISILIVVLDQAWKNIMLDLLCYGEPIPIIKGLFSLTLVFNQGAAFGILPGQKKIFLVLPVLTVILVLAIFIRAKNKGKVIIPVGLLIGGATGNFIDRVRFGYVIDFFDFYIDKYHWPAFNFADISICAGIILLIWMAVFSDHLFDSKQINKNKRSKL